MATLSQRRKTALAADATIVRGLYAEACARWGKNATDQDLTRLWDLRCMKGMQDIIPFRGGMETHTLGELLYVAREVCGLGVPTLLRQEP